MTTEVNKTILNNGIRILTKNVPHVRSVSMGVWVNVGARDETFDESGLSHFIEHMIFKGTRKRDAFQIAKEFDAIGGQTNAFTSTELTCYHAKVMDSHLETMVEILSDIFLNSLFDPIEVERERPVILQEIGMVEDTPEEFVHTILSHNFWGEHPLGRSILGTQENLVRFDAGTIKNFFHRFYQPERIVISVAGNLDHNGFIDLIKPTFEPIKSGNSLPKRELPMVAPRSSITQRDLEQVHICMGMEGLGICDPKRYALSLLNTILGGNMSSRLFQEIRENRGLAYSVYSFMSSNVDSGMVGVYAGVSPQKVNETIEVILNELKTLGQKKIDSAELHDAKEFTKGNILLSLENTDNLMVRLAQNEIHFNREIPIENIIKKIEDVTRDEILDLAQDIFEKDQMAFSILGPVSDQESVNAIIEKHCDTR
ncbi:MAG: insulinase family protein [Desulfobacterales bacterium]|nr:insulinase family protein [Desulfobacterales bacterium]